MAVLAVEITFCLIRKQELYGTIKMVTAALRHCLINTIVLEIMVSVIYLCNITDLVIVHVVDSYPVWRSQQFQNLFPLIQGKKIASVYLKCPWLSWARIMYLSIFSPSVARAKSLWQCLVHIENWWVILNWLFFFFCPSECSQVLTGCTSQQCHFMFNSYFPAEPNLVALLEGRNGATFLT